MAQTAHNRTYRSDVRDARAAQTRERILDAVVIVMHRDPAGFTIPQVAKEAGVAVPTVYRHFPNKNALVTALQEQVDARLRVAQWPAPSASLDELVDYLRIFFESYASLPPELRRLSRSLHVQEARTRRRAARLTWFDQALDGYLSAFPAAEREIARDVIAVLFSTASVDTFENYLGADVDGTIARVEWAIRRLLGAPPARDDDEGKKSKKRTRGKKR